MSHGGGGGIVMYRNDGTPMSKKEVIVLRRGAFKWLPVLCSNDLVHGSWWMVAGSLASAIFAVIPLIQDYESFYHKQDDMLPATDFELTWALLIFSGVAYTLGSLAFVRAFEEPSQKAMFWWNRHLQSDELVGAWLFMLGTLPAVPYSLVFFFIQPTFTYMGVFIASLVFVLGTVLFVLACYPSDRKIENYLLPYCLRTFGAQMWVVKHLANDWLAGTWFFLWANFLVTIGSVLTLFIAFASGNPGQMFIYAFSFIISMLFLVGSVYFVAGSYPHAQAFYYVHNRGGTGGLATHVPGQDLEIGGRPTDDQPLVAGTTSSSSSSSSSSTNDVGTGGQAMEYRHLQDQDTVNPLHGAPVSVSATAPSPHTSAATASTAANSGGGGVGGSKSSSKTTSAAKVVRPVTASSSTNVALPSALASLRPEQLLTYDDEDDNMDDDDDEVDENSHRPPGRERSASAVLASRRV